MRYVSADLFSAATRKLRVARSEQTDSLTSTSSIALAECDPRVGAGTEANSREISGSCRRAIRIARCAVAHSRSLARRVLLVAAAPSCVVALALAMSN